MAKKKKPQTAKNSFRSNPFNSLKGFAVSEQEQAVEKLDMAAPEKKPVKAYGTFADEMALLGVERLDGAEAGEEHAEQTVQESVEEDCSQPPVSEADEFLQALGDMEVTFTDRLPDDESPPSASARRMKQLKQGRLAPEASLDLHGYKRTEVAAKLRFFLQDCQHQGFSTLLVITGKGLHSADGEAVLRLEAERFLKTEGRKTVAEWGRAPKQYGGDGALVLFLRKHK